MLRVLHLKLTALSPDWLSCSSESFRGKYWIIPCNWPLPFPSTSFPIHHSHYDSCGWLRSLNKARNKDVIDKLEILIIPAKWKINHCVVLPCVSRKCSVRPSDDIIATMRWAIPALHNTPSWHGAQLKRYVETDLSGCLRNMYKKENDPARFSFSFVKRWYSRWSSFSA
jgi:hypothetical protein